MSSVLLACQSIPISSTHQGTDRSQALQTVSIDCAGTDLCQFVRVDDVHMFENGWLSHQALSTGVVRYKATSLGEYHRLSFYLSVPATRHEIDVEFYPISPYRAEKFTLIHTFKAGHHYTLQMYRKKYPQKASLLEVSAPSPLCINLLQDQLVIRRFCRDVDAVTGFGEFVEQKVRE